MQNNYPAFHRFDSQFQPQQNGNFINKLKLKFKNSNKKMLAAAISVILAGVMVGGILKANSSNQTFSESIPQGEVEGALTQATFTPSPTQTPGPTLDPNSTPLELPTNTPLDTSAEGAGPTVPPTATPNATAIPTPTPATYTATISSISNSPAAANGNSTITIVVAVTNNGNADCGESVYLISDKAGVSFSSDSCSSGKNTFTATSTTPQTYTITPEVYGLPYATGTITFN
jgi:hypothetical protein